MISYNTLLKEIEKQVIQAKSIHNEQQLREHLSAIRALCDVGLATSPIETTKKTEQSSHTIQTSTTSPTLIEEDANGASIFDF